MRPQLSPHWLAHAWKALAQQHHRDLLPLLSSLLPRDGVAVDVGAHAGQFTKLFARLAPEGRVIAVEPSPYALSILRTVVRLKRLERVTIVPKGLSDRPGSLVLNSPIKRSGAIGYGLASFAAAASARPVRSDTVAVDTLDRLADALGLARCDLIKCDVEGWEVQVLEGGRGVLERFRPALLVEVSAASLARSGQTPERLWSLVAPLGYAAARLPGGEAVAGFAGDADYLFRAAAKPAAQAASPPR
jgi:FkbM family methyltransferase